MSTWTDEKHKNVREAVERFRGEDGVLGVPPSLMGDALDEIERLRAMTTTTDDMVGRAHAAVVEHLSANAGCVYAEDEGPDMLRTALEAALTPKENEA